MIGCGFYLGKQSEDKQDLQIWRSSLLDDVPAIIVIIIHHHCHPNLLLRHHRCHPNLLLCHHHCHPNPRHYHHHCHPDPCHRHSRDCLFLHQRAHPLKMQSVLVRMNIEICKSAFTSNIHPKSCLVTRWLVVTTEDFITILSRELLADRHAVFFQLCHETQQMKIQVQIS